MNSADALNAERLEIEIAELEKRSESVNRALRVCRENLRALKAKEFIRINKITMDDIEMPEGDGKPYFHTIDAFIDWLRKNSTKNWAVWNTQLHRASDLLAGRWTDSGVYVGDVQNS